MTNRELMNMVAKQRGLILVEEDMPLFRSLVNDWMALDDSCTLAEAIEHAAYSEDPWNPDETTRPAESN